MSGIAGVYHLDGRPVDQTGLQRMVSTLAHRGPDGTGLWMDGSVGLGHRMLHTTPESLRERQPMTDSTGELVVTADARIDNREELIKRLGLGERPSSEISDSELILSAYARWGDCCPEKLLGDFVFVIWDGRLRRLFCARDPMGVKPLYYFGSHRLFAFASEIKGLLCLPGVPRRLNETRVADYLVGLFEDKAITLYQDILRLPPAHSITVDRDRTWMRTHWSPDLAHEVRLSSDQEYAEAFREIFFESVRCRLRTISPVGANLSGGLDSSSIVCTARELLARTGEPHLHTFSAIFPTVAPVDARIDERSYVDAVVAAGDLESHYIRADRLSPLAEHGQVLWHADEAVPAPNLYLDWEIMGAAQQRGIRVMLSGFDGDSAVSHGYEALFELVRRGQWGTMVAEAKAVLNRFNSSASLWKLIWDRGIRPLAPKPIVEMWRLVRGRPQVSLPIVTPIDPSFSLRVGLQERARDLQSSGSRLIPRAREMHWAVLTSGLLAYVLELLDKSAAAHSLEVRFPFFDRRLLEFCLALPPTQKIRKGWTRAILRSAMDGILPQEVRCRVNKSNLGANFKLRLLEHERETLEATISDPSHTIGRYVDLTALDAMYQKYASQPMQHEREALALFFAVTLDIWLRTAGFASTGGPATTSPAL